MCVVFFFVNPQRHYFMSFSSLNSFLIINETRVGRGNVLFSLTCQNTKKKHKKKTFSEKGKNFFINILSPNSYRLELMRQIYNTAESPEMTTFQMMDVSSSAGNNNASDAKVSTRYESVAPSSNNRNSLRLSLANLLPSRLAIFFL